LYFQYMKKYQIITSNATHYSARLVVLPQTA
jgi:hypothetical protein